MSILIEAELESAVNNLPSFRSEALLPVFEAVVNSIQAIEERASEDRGEIVIRVERTGQRQIEASSQRERPISGFVIEDNGIGFNEANYQSFRKLGTSYKADKGCKGMGRFYWLKAFSSVHIDSVYDDSGQHKHRTMKFSTRGGFEDLEHKDTAIAVRTRVHLNGYIREYREQPSAFKRTETIAQRILEHCLSFYLAKSAPKISVADEEGTVELDSLFAQIQLHIRTDSFDVGNKNFQLTHVRLYATHSGMHNIVLCANDRDVQRISISSLLGTQQQFDDDGKRFVYAAYVSGEYLDNHVAVTRINFDIPESEGVFDAGGPSLNEIKEAAKQYASAYLRPVLDKIQEQKRLLVDRYIAEENPSLRAVPTYCPEALDELEPNSSGDRVDEVLHKYKGKAEREVRHRSAQLLKTQPSSLSEIEDKYRDVVDKLEDFQRDNLAGYMLLRKAIIELLEKKLEICNTGRYEYESVIHDIFFPRKTNSDSIRLEDHNLWLLDDRLAFHSHANSDKPLDQLMDGASRRRPDILTFAEIDEDKVARSVSIIELKQPQMRRIAEEPASQGRRYVREIREKGTVKLPNGREIRITEETRCYVYAICDLVPHIREYAESNSYSPMKGELGYYNYIPNPLYSCHVELIAFDKIVTDAKRRHRIFFDKLGV